MQPENKFLVTCSSRSEIKGLEEKFGIAANHAYSIMSIHFVNHPRTNEKITLLKLRNPWGK